MSSYILIIGISIFIMCLCLHILIWRWRHPHHHIITLSIIFIIVPTAISIVGFILLWFNLLPFDIANIISISASGWLLVFLLHFSLSGAYILSYPAIQAVSPSLAILLIVRSYMPDGLAYTELRSHFTVEDLLEARINDLKDALLVTESDGYLRLAPRGFFLIRFTGFLRKLLGLSVGKG